MKNYFDFGKTLSGRWKNYTYVDTGDPQLVSLLARRHVFRLKVDGVYGRDGDEYVYIALRVRVRDDERFLLALEELKNKMLICGYRDYEDRAGEMIRKLEQTVMKELAAGKRIVLSNGRRARIDPKRFGGSGIKTDQCAAE